jgi:hypothetical protein
MALFAADAPPLIVRLGLRKTDDFLPGLELPALLEKIDPLETLQNVALGDDGTLAFETAMLRHDDGGSFQEKGREL